MRLAAWCPVIASLLIAAAAGCASEPARVDEMQQRPISEVLAEHAPRWMDVEGVVGVYEGATDDGAPCLKVMVVRETPQLRKLIPEAVDGYRVLLRETGPVAPRDQG